MKIRKKGATEWTIGKLIALILLLIVIALVIFGLFTGAFTPAKNKLVGFYDWVLSLFGKGKGMLGDCSIFENLLVYKDGTGSEIKGKLSLCQEECKVDLNDGKGSYRFLAKELDDPKLWVYEKIYVVFESPIKEDPLNEWLHPELYLFKAYFRFNKATEKWEWSAEKKYWSNNPEGYSYYLERGKPVSITISSRIRENVIKFIKDMNFEHGKKFFEDGLKTEKGKFSSEKNWVEIDHEVVPPFKIPDEDSNKLAQNLLKIKGEKNGYSEIKINIEGKDYETWFDEYAGLAADLGDDIYKNKDYIIPEQKPIEEEFKDVKNSYVIEFKPQGWPTTHDVTRKRRELLFFDGIWYNYKTGAELDIKYATLATDFQGLNYAEGIRKIVTFVEDKYFDLIRIEDRTAPAGGEFIYSFSGTNDISSSNEEAIRKFAEEAMVKDSLPEDKGCYAYGRLTDNNLKIYNVRFRYAYDTKGILQESAIGVCAGFNGKPVAVSDANRNLITGIKNAFETALKNEKITYKGKEYILDIDVGIDGDGNNLAILKLSGGAYAVDDWGRLWDWDGTGWKLNYMALSDEGLARLNTNKEIKAWLQDNCK